MFTFRAFLNIRMLLTESEKAKQLRTRRTHHKDLLLRIITCCMANEDYPESLKLEIIHAIDDQSTGFNE